jgi:hypothetical protein
MGVVIQLPLVATMTKFLNAIDELHTEIAILFGDDEFVDRSIALRWRSEDFDSDSKVENHELEEKFNNIDKFFKELFAVPDPYLALECMQIMVYNQGFDLTHSMVQPRGKYKKLRLKIDTDEGHIALVHEIDKSQSAITMIASRGAILWQLSDNDLQS